MLIFRAWATCGWKDILDSGWKRNHESWIIIKNLLRITNLFFLKTRESWLITTLLFKIPVFKRRWCLLHWKRSTLSTVTTYTRRLGDTSRSDSRNGSIHEQCRSHLEVQGTSGKALPRASKWTIWRLLKRCAACSGCRKQNLYKPLWRSWSSKILEKIVRTLLLLFSCRPFAASLVIKFDVIVNEVVLFSSRIR